MTKKNYQASALVEKRMYNEVIDATDLKWDITAFCKKKNLHSPIIRLYLIEDIKVLVYAIWKRPFWALFAKDDRITSTCNPSFIVPALAYDEMQIQALFPEFRADNICLDARFAKVTDERFVLCGEDVLWIDSTAQIHKVISILNSADMLKVAELKGITPQGCSPVLIKNMVVWKVATETKDDFCTVSLPACLNDVLPSAQEDSIYLIGKSLVVDINQKKYRLQYSLQKKWYFSSEIK